MKYLHIHRGNPLCGVVKVPGDKSISHRALLLSALASGMSRISNFLHSHDCLATQACLQAMGIEIEVDQQNDDSHLGSSFDDFRSSLKVFGQGLHGLHRPALMLNCVRSGTTMRLLTGMLAGQSFDCILTGDIQLKRRPMERVAEPLRHMGAKIDTFEGHAPLYIQGQRLSGIHHNLAIASAQVKSAILLAGLYAQGTTTVRLPSPTRDHTERMLSLMGVKLESRDTLTTLEPTDSLSPISREDEYFRIPGDISSAAFLLVAAIIIPNSEINIEGVGINPTRMGLLDVLREMGANIRVEEVAYKSTVACEPSGNMTGRASALRGVEIKGDTVVRMIDEFPILAVAATQAYGSTIVHDASELRVKETDRIANIVSELRKMGAKIEPLPDGFIVEGRTPLKGANVNSYGDHRLAMALAVAGLIAEQEVFIEDIECINDSFPGFVQIMQKLGADYE